MTRLPYWEQLTFRLLYVAQRPVYGLDITEMPKIEIYDRREPFPQQGYYDRERTMRFGIDPTSPRALDDAFAIASHEFGHHLQTLAGTRDMPAVYVREQARLKELLPGWEHHPVEVEAEETRRIIQPRLAAAQTMIVPSRPVAFEEIPPEERARQALRTQAEAIAAAGKGRVVTGWEIYRALETRAKNPLIAPIVVRGDITAARKEGIISEEQADTLLGLLSERELSEREAEERRIREREEREWREKREAETAALLERERKLKIFRLLQARASDTLIAPVVVRGDIEAARREGNITDSQAQLLLDIVAFRERGEERKAAARRTEAEKLEIELRGAGYGKLRNAARTSTPATFAVVENAIIRGVGEGTITVAQQGELLAILDAKRFG